MTVLCLVVTAYSIVLIAHVIFSWVPRPPEPIMPLVKGVHQLVEPVARPIRNVLPPLRIGGVGLDLSILVLLLVVILLQSAFC